MPNDKMYKFGVGVDKKSLDKIRKDLADIIKPFEDAMANVGTDGLTGSSKSKVKSELTSLFKLTEKQAQALQDMVRGVVPSDETNIGNLKQNIHDLVVFMTDAMQRMSQLGKSEDWVKSGVSFVDTFTHMKDVLGQTELFVKDLRDSVGGLTSEFQTFKDALLATNPDAFGKHFGAEIRATTDDIKKAQRLIDSLKTNEHKGVSNATLVTADDDLEDYSKRNIDAIKESHEDIQGEIRHHLEIIERIEAEHRGNKKAIYDVEEYQEAIHGLAVELTNFEHLKGAKHFEGAFANIGAEASESVKGATVDITKATEQAVKQIKDALSGIEGIEVAVTIPDANSAEFVSKVQNFVDDATKQFQKKPIEISVDMVSPFKTKQGEDTEAKLGKKQQEIFDAFKNVAEKSGTEINEEDLLGVKDKDVKNISLNILDAFTKIQKIMTSGQRIITDSTSKWQKDMNELLRIKPFIDVEATRDDIAKALFEISELSDESESWLRLHVDTDKMVDEIEEALKEKKFEVNLSGGDGVKLNLNASDINWSGHSGQPSEPKQSDVPPANQIPFVPAQPAPQNEAPKKEKQQSTQVKEAVNAEQENTRMQKVLTDAVRDLNATIDSNTAKNEVTNADIAKLKEKESYVDNAKVVGAIDSEIASFKAAKTDAKSKSKVIHQKISKIEDDIEAELKASRDKHQMVNEAFKNDDITTINKEFNAAVEFWNKEKESLSIRLKQAKKDNDTDTTQQIEEQLSKIDSLLNGNDKKNIILESVLNASRQRRSDLRDLLDPLREEAKKADGLVQTYTDKINNAKQLKAKVGDQDEIDRMEKRVKDRESHSNASQKRIDAINDVLSGKNNPIDIIYEQVKSFWEQANEKKNSDKPDVAKDWTKKAAAMTTKGLVDVTDMTPEDAKKQILSLLQRYSSLGDALSGDKLLKTLKPIKELIYFIPTIQDALGFKVQTTTEYDLEQQLQGRFKEILKINEYMKVAAGLLSEGQIDINPQAIQQFIDYFGHIPGMADTVSRAQQYLEEIQKLPEEAFDTEKPKKYAEQIQEIWTKLDSSAQNTLLEALNRSGEFGDKPIPGISDWNQKTDKNSPHTYYDKLLKAYGNANSELTDLQTDNPQLKEIIAILHRSHLLKQTTNAAYEYGDNGIMALLHEVQKTNLGGKRNTPKEALHITTTDDKGQETVFELSSGKSAKAANKRYSLNAKAMSKFVKRSGYEEDIDTITQLLLDPAILAKDRVETEIRGIQSDLTHLASLRSTFARKNQNSDSEEIMRENIRSLSRNAFDNTELEGVWKKYGNAKKQAADINSVLKANLDVVQFPEELWNSVKGLRKQKRLEKEITTLERGIRDGSYKDKNEKKKWEGLVVSKKSELESVKAENITKLQGMLTGKMQYLAKIEDQIVAKTKEVIAVKQTELAAKKQELKDITPEANKAEQAAQAMMDSLLESGKFKLSAGKNADTAQYTREYKFKDTKLAKHNRDEENKIKQREQVEAQIAKLQAGEYDEGTLSRIQAIKDNAGLSDDDKTTQIQKLVNELIEDRHKVLERLQATEISQEDVIDSLLVLEDDMRISEAKKTHSRTQARRAKIKNEKIRDTANAQAELQYKNEVKKQKDAIYDEATQMQINAAGTSQATPVKFENLIKRIKFAKEHGLMDTTELEKLVDTYEDLAREAQNVTNLKHEGKASAEKVSKAFKDADEARKALVDKYFSGDNWFVAQNIQDQFATIDAELNESIREINSNAGAQNAGVQSQIDAIKSKHKVIEQTKETYFDGLVDKYILAPQRKVEEELKKRSNDIKAHEKETKAKIDSLTSQVDKDPEIKALRDSLFKAKESDPVIQELRKSRSETKFVSERELLSASIRQLEKEYDAEYHEARQKWIADRTAQLEADHKAFVRAIKDQAIENVESSAAKQFNVDMEGKVDKQVETFSGIKEMIEQMRQQAREAAEAELAQALASVDMSKTISQADIDALITEARRKAEEEKKKVLEAQRGKTNRQLFAENYVAKQTHHTEKKSDADKVKTEQEKIYKAEMDKYGITEEMLAAAREHRLVLQDAVKTEQENANLTEERTEAAKQAQQSADQSSGGQYRGGYGGVVNIDTSKLAREGTLRGIYELLNGGAPEGGWGDEDKFASDIKDEMDLSVKSFSGSLDNLGNSIYKFAQQANKLDHENMVFFNEIGKVGRAISGSTNGIDGKQIRSFVNKYKGENLNLALHNHPDGMASLSPADIESAVALAIKHGVGAFGSVTPDKITGVDFSGITEELGLQIINAYKNGIRTSTFAELFDDQFNIKEEFAAHPSLDKQKLGNELNRILQEAITSVGLNASDIFGQVDVSSLSAYSKSAVEAAVEKTIEQIVEQAVKTTTESIQQINGTPKSGIDIAKSYYASLNLSDRQIDHNSNKLVTQALQYAFGQDPNGTNKFYFMGSKDDANILDPSHYIDKYKTIDSILQLIGYHLDELQPNMIDANNQFGFSTKVVANSDRVVTNLEEARSILFDLNANKPNDVVAQSAVDATIKETEAQKVDTQPVEQATQQASDTIVTTVSDIVRQAAAQVSDTDISAIISKIADEDFESIAKHTNEDMIKAYRLEIEDANYQRQNKLIDAKDDYKTAINDSDGSEESTNAISTKYEERKREIWEKYNATIQQAAIKLAKHICERMATPNAQHVDAQPAQQAATKVAEAVVEAGAQSAVDVTKDLIAMPSGEIDEKTPKELANIIYKTKGKQDGSTMISSALSSVSKLGLMLDNYEFKEEDGAALAKIYSQLKQGMDKPIGDRLHQSVKDYIGNITDILEAIALINNLDYAAINKQSQDGAQNMVQSDAKKALDELQKLKDAEVSGSKRAYGGLSDIDKIISKGKDKLTENELRELGIGYYKLVETINHKIYDTLDPDIQQILQQAKDKALEVLTKHNVKVRGGDEFNGMLITKENEKFVDVLKNQSGKNTGNKVGKYLYDLTVPVLERTHTKEDGTEYTRIIQKARGRLSVEQEITQEKKKQNDLTQQATSQEKNAAQATKEQAQTAKEVNKAYATALTKESVNATKSKLGTFTSTDKDGKVSKQAGVQRAQNGLKNVYKVLQKGSSNLDGEDLEHLQTGYRQLYETLDHAIFKKLDADTKEILTHATNEAMEVLKQNGVDVSTVIKNQPKPKANGGSNGGAKGGNEGGILGILGKLAREATLQSIADLLSKGIKTTSGKDKDSGDKDTKKKDSTPITVDEAYEKMKAYASAKYPNITLNPNDVKSNATGYSMNITRPKNYEEAEQIQANINKLIAEGKANTEEYIQAQNRLNALKQEQEVITLRISAIGEDGVTERSAFSNLASGAKTAIKELEIADATMARLKDNDMLSFGDDGSITSSNEAVQEFLDHYLALQKAKDNMSAEQLFNPVEQQGLLNMATAVQESRKEVEYLLQVLTRYDHAGGIGDVVTSMTTESKAVDKTIATLKNSGMLSITEDGVATSSNKVVQDFLDAVWTYNDVVDKAKSRGDLLNESEIENLQNMTFAIQNYRKEVDALLNTIAKTNNVDRTGIGAKAAIKELNGTDNMMSMLQVRQAISFGADGTVDSNIKQVQQYLRTLRDLQDFTNGLSIAELYDPSNQKQLSIMTLEVQKYKKEVLALLDAFDKENVGNSIGNFFKDLNGLSDSEIKLAMQEMVAGSSDFKASFGGMQRVMKDGEVVSYQLAYTLRTGKREVQEMTASLNPLTREVTLQAGEVKAAQTKWDAFIGGLKGKFSSIIQYIASITSIQDFIRYIRTGVQYVKEIDSALTELKKVTNETDASYAKFLQNMAKTGSVIGATVTDLTTMAAEWSKLGYSMQDAATLAESTAILLNVSEFQDANAASEALISTMQAFQYTADESMHVVDILNEVGEFVAHR